MNTLLNTFLAKIRLGLPIAILLISLAGLAGCTIKPLTPQQEALQMADGICSAQTNAMLSPLERGNLSWGDYYAWCMENQGVTPEELKTLWY